MKDLLYYAFIGDAVHTLFVRENISKNKDLKMDSLNRYASKFCRASHQAKVLDSIYSELTEDEKELVRKTRNIKNKHKAKNVDVITYKKATCFETLVGFYHVENNNERLSFLLNKSLEGDN